MSMGGEFNQHKMTLCQKNIEGKDYNDLCDLGNNISHQFCKDDNSDWYDAEQTKKKKSILTRYKSAKLEVNVYNYWVLETREKLLKIVQAVQQNGHKFGRSDVTRLSRMFIWREQAPAARMTATKSDSILVMEHFQHALDFIKALTGNLSTFREYQEKRRTDWDAADSKRALRLAKNAVKCFRDSMKKGSHCVKGSQWRYQWGLMKPVPRKPYVRKVE